MMCVRDREREVHINLGYWRSIEGTIDINGQASGIFLGGAQGKRKKNKKDRDEELMSLHDLMWFEEGTSKTVQDMKITIS